MNPMSRIRAASNVIPDEVGKGGILVGGDDGSASWVE